MNTIGQLMNVGLHKVPHDLTLSACEWILRREGLRHLVLIDHHGLHHGIASDLEILAGCRSGGARRKVGEIADPGRVRVRPDTPVTSALAQMLRVHSDHAVVLGDQGEPVGLLTEKEILELGRVAIRPWMKVSERMTRGRPLHVSPQSTADEALGKMIAHETRHLLVIDAANELVGVVSKRDLMGVPEFPVGEVVTRKVHFIREDHTIGEAVDVMCAHRIGCLPVLDSWDRMKGILTRTDVARALAQQLVETGGPQARAQVG